MSETAKILATNLAHVRRRMEAAAARCSRSPADILLVAVTKYVDAAVARALLEIGCVDLGESRPQELWQKAEALPGAPVRWHLIGHLQRNKARRTLPYVSLVHSGDSLRLLAELNRLAGELQRNVPTLLEVNVSGDAAKHGFWPAELEAAMPQIALFPNLQVRGLMAMAGREGDLEGARADFARLRRLRDQLLLNCPPNVELRELSMGMSGDLEVAIEEGATMVRVGSALFEGLAP